MTRAVLIRDETSDHGTLGTLALGALRLDTMEPPWRGNRRNESCVPAGTYGAAPHVSPRFDAFWRDPITDMRRNLPRMMRELALFGEQCWPVFADPKSGHVRLGYLDPARIETVVCDPDNAAQPVGVVILEEVAAFVVRRRLDPSATSADGSDLGADLTPAVEWPETAVRDAARHASALSEVAAAATAAADRGLLREETALKLIRAVAEPLGVAFDPASELVAAREEAARRSERGQGGEGEERREAVRNAAPPSNFT